MKKAFVYFITLFILSLFISSSIYSQKISLQPPKPEKIKKVLENHGNQRIDYYYWMNERNNPKVIDYLNSENDYTDAMMKHTENLRQKLYGEITGRIAEEDKSIPYKKNGYYYYSKYENGNKYPVYCRKKGNLDAPEEIFLNVNEQAKGFKIFRLADFQISPDNRILCFMVDTAGNRLYTLFFKDLAAGKMLSYRIPGTGGDVIWANDNKTIFYSLNDKTVRNYKVMKYVLGDPTDSAKTFLEETDVKFEFYISRSRSGKFLYFESYSKTSNEFKYLDADNPDSKIKLIQPRTKDLLYDVQDDGNNFYIRTNYHTRNFDIMYTEISNPSIENWKDLISYDKETFLKRFVVFDNFIAALEFTGGLIQIRIININDKSWHYIDFGEETYYTGFDENPDTHTDDLRYEFSSLTRPASIYQYNMQIKETVLLKQDKVQGNYDPGNFESKRIFVTARDGAKIPLSLVYKKGIRPDGNNPLLLYAYGAYGNSRNDDFSPDRISLLDRGFVYAIAHVRGGQEMGRQWYVDGKLLKKMNTFTDFIDCAEYLIHERYTSSSKLCAIGKSAGGMLMAGVANMRPDLLK